MSAVVASAPAQAVRPRPAAWRHPALRAVISIAVFLAFWELASRLKWPWIGQAPAPSVVARDQGMLAWIKGTEVTPGS